MRNAFVIHKVSGGVEVANQMENQTQPSPASSVLKHPIRSKLKLKFASTRCNRPISFNVQSDSNSAISAFQTEYESTFTPPPFTYSELKQAIPPHLFERDNLTSALYLTANLGASIFLFLLAKHIDDVTTTYQSLYVQYVAWPLYWILQGISGTGLWVLGHECGHGAFSPNYIANHIIGFILHSFLLVPYHSWRISHIQHHTRRAHIEKEPTFLPPAKNPTSPQHTTSPWIEAIEDSPIYTFLKLLIFLLFGWPAYLLANASGPKYPRFANLIFPSSPIFKSNQRHQILISDGGLIAVLCLLVCWAKMGPGGWVTVIKIYVIPYLFVNGALVAITLLQHTDLYLPFYSEEEWTFVRGALSTVDRDFGWFLNMTWHHITDSHVVHHLFAQIPHYNAVEATKALRAKLGDYYIVDDTPPCTALWRIVRNCVVVEAARNSGVFFYRRR